MLEFFRKNLFVFNGLLLAYCIILRLAGFFKSAPIADDKNLLSDLLLSILEGPQGKMALVVALLLVLLNAIQINRLVNINRITPSSSLFPGLFYILISSFCLPLQTLSPILLANCFLILLLLEVFKQTRNEDLLIRTFNVGFLAGIASLFYMPYMILLPLGIFGMINVRTFKSMDYFRALLGFLSPFLIAVPLLFYLDLLPLLWTGHFAESFAILDFSYELSWIDYAIFALFGIGIMMTVFGMNSLTYKANIHTRRKYSTLLIFSIALTVLVPFVASTGVQSMTMLTVPLSIFLGSFFLTMEKQLAEVLHFVLLAIALTFQYIV